MEKSHVGTGFYVCPVCGNKHGEVVLLDKRLKSTLTQNTYMGLAVCKEDQELFDQGYIALIGVENQSDKSTLKFEDADRTGEVMHIKKSIWSVIFKDAAEPKPEDYFFFVEQDALEHLKKLKAEAEESDSE